MAFTVETQEKTMKLRILTWLLPMLIWGTHAMAEPYEKAIFAGGCFWCTEAIFDGLPGVISATSGYTGGEGENPSYEQVGSGATGHREAVEVVYDPEKITYPELLEAFWVSIDPTDEGGQFYDRGSQYQTAIYYLNDAQKKQAEATKKEAEVALDTHIATEILPATEFYPAEDYHQDYHLKNPDRYNRYKYGSGRPARLKEIWKDKAPE